MEANKNESVTDRPTSKSRSQESLKTTKGPHSEPSKGIAKGAAWSVVNDMNNEPDDVLAESKNQNNNIDLAEDAGVSPTQTEIQKPNTGKTTTSSGSSQKSSARNNSANEVEHAAWNSIKVVVRVRPINATEMHKEGKASIEYPSEGVIWANFQGNTKPFTFNTVFQESAGQVEIFEQCGIKDLIEKALDGFSCTAFAFGQTGSGKTYTITGPFNPDSSEVLPSEDLYGLLPRSFEHLLSETKKRVETYTIKAAYLEVYNEKVKDLLNPSRARDSLPVRWSSNRGFYVENLFMMECDTSEDLMIVLEEGLKNRQVGAHSMNDYSSRSHTMLTVYLDSEMFDPEDDLPITKQGKISFVDLAGNERVKETKQTGEALTESQNINKSLLTLGNCISALGDPKKRSGHIPYRESKLTKLLADSIGGEGFTLMIACISPSSSAMQDTLNTLRYANRAKNIKNKPVVKMDSREQLIISMKREMKLLKAENAYFRQQLNIPCSDAQVVLTREQIPGVMSADESSQVLSPAIGTNTLSSVESSGRNSSLDDKLDSKSEEIGQRATTAMYAMSANVGLYDMLQEYILENETLRQQNSDLFKIRRVLEKDFETLSMKNDSLTQKLGTIERALSSTSLSFHSDGSTIIDSREGKRSIFHEQTGPPFNLTLPPLRSGTYPNIISGEVDLAAEVEREHKRIKEERARKQREKEVDEHEARKPAKDSEKKATKDLNQNNIGGKPEESKSNGNAVSKKQDSNTLVGKESHDKDEHVAAKPKNHFKYKWRTKYMNDKDKAQNSYAAKFAVRKNLGPHAFQSHQHLLQTSTESEKKSVANEHLSKSNQELPLYQTDASQSSIGNQIRPLMNRPQDMNDQLRMELDQLQGQIQKEFAFNQLFKPTYHGR